MLLGSDLLNEGRDSKAEMELALCLTFTILPMKPRNNHSHKGKEDYESPEH